MHAASRKNSPNSQCDGCSVANIQPRVRIPMIVNVADRIIPRFRGSLAALERYLRSNAKGYTRPAQLELYQYPRRQAANARPLNLVWSVFQRAAGIMFRLAVERGSRVADLRSQEPEHRNDSKFPRQRKTCVLNRRNQLGIAQQNKSDAGECH